MNFIIIGKIVIALVFMVVLILCLFLAAVLMELVSDFVHSLPEWIQTIIGIVGLLSVFIFIFCKIFSVL